MKGGFTFCGVDIADIGLEYAPDNKEAYVYAPAKSELYEQTFEGHDGGYYFGNSKQPKEFHLRCFYQDQHVLKGLMARAFSLFAVGNSGELVFKNRPWCYYYATVTETNIEDMYNYMNGIFTVTLKAYYPFARGLPVNDHLFYNLLTDDYHHEAMENTGLFDNDYMMPPTTITFPNLVNRYFEANCDTTKRYKVIMEDPSYDPSNPVEFTGTMQCLDAGWTTIASFAYRSEGGKISLIMPNSDLPYPEGVKYLRTRLPAGKTGYIAEYKDTFLLYNPGTEKAKLSLSFVGEAGDGFTVANKQTRQQCKYINFTKDDGEIHTDGINGKTVAIKNGEQKLAFLYHDHGYIDLEPAFPIIRDLIVTSNGATITTPKILYKTEDEKKWYEDKYIFVGINSSGKWVQINRCEDEHTISLKSPGGYGGTFKTCIVPMNEIKITSSIKTNFDTISFIYKPTFA